MNVAASCAASAPSPPWFSHLLARRHRPPTDVFLKASRGGDDFELGAPPDPPCYGEGPPHFIPRQGFFARDVEDPMSLPPISSMTLLPGGVPSVALSPERSPSSDKPERGDSAERDVGVAGDWRLCTSESPISGGPLWDKTLSYDNEFRDFKLEYVDLDELLTEDGLPLDPSEREPPLCCVTPKTEDRPPSPLEQPCPRLDGGNSGAASGGPPCLDRGAPPCLDNPLPPTPESPNGITASRSSPLDVSPQGDPVKIPGHNFDPTQRRFSEEELKPQPMIKKSRKQYVPSDLKDEKYWARRRKNNIAAKRSRDARRVKENQIVLRARYLEKENENLIEELKRTKLIVETLKKRLAAYEAV